MCEEFACSITSCYCTSGYKTATCHCPSSSKFGLPSSSSQFIGEAHRWRDSSMVENSRLHLHVFESRASNNSLKKVASQVNEVELTASERGSISIDVSKEIKDLYRLTHESCNDV